MELTLVEGNAATVRAGYSCACGCTPSVTYARGTDLAEDRCCCGNYFAVGPLAGVTLESKDDFRVDHGADAASTIDRVCGMTVGPQAARSAGLHLAYRGQDYFFCGKGCLFEFRDDPDRYLDPEYVASM